MLGITSVPSGPKADRSAAINPSGPSSTGFTWEKAQCTSTPPGCTPNEQLPGDLALGDHCSLHVVLLSRANLEILECDGKPLPSGDAHINPTCVTAGTR